MLFHHVRQQLRDKSHAMEIEDLPDRIQALEFTNEAHQQEILRLNKEHKKAIEEKDAAPALLKDDLQNREYENVALQAQRDVYEDQLQKYQDIITHLKTRYGDHVKDPGKDHIVMIFEKNTAPEEDEFMSIPTILQEYSDGSLTQKGDGLRQNIHTTS